MRLRSFGQRQLAADNGPQGACLETGNDGSVNRSQLRIGGGKENQAENRGLTRHCFARRALVLALPPLAELEGFPGGALLGISIDALFLGDPALA